MMIAIPNIQANTVTPQACTLQDSSTIGPSKTFKPIVPSLDRAPIAIDASRVNFGNTSAPGIGNSYLCILDSVLSREECNELLEAAEAQADSCWNRVKEISDCGNTTTRNCERIMWDSPELVARLWARIAYKVPELQRLGDSQSNGEAGHWNMTRVNERMRFLKYDQGEYFHPHPDCFYEASNGKERSLITVYLYLNDADQRSDGSGFTGGSTVFYSTDLTQSFEVLPKAGRVLLFEQETMVHSGEAVTEGTKFAMRTDLMYEFH